MEGGKNNSSYKKQIHFDWPLFMTHKIPIYTENNFVYNSFCCCWWVCKLDPLEAFGFEINNHVGKILFITFALQYKESVRVAVKFIPAIIALQ